MKCHNSLVLVSGEPTEFLKPQKPAMFAESSAPDLFRKFMENEINCSTSQMARKPMNVNKNQLFKNGCQCNIVTSALFKTQHP